MNLVTVESNLRELGFGIICVREIDYGHQIRLSCGAVINVYDRGTVLAQGKVPGERRDELMNQLKHTLPPDTRWCIK